MGVPKDEYEYMYCLTLTAIHNNCRLLCHLLVILKVIFANSVLL